MKVDVLVRGDGCVGRSLALALAAQGLRVALQGRQTPQGDDIRAYALNAASQSLLQRLRVWDALPDQARTPVNEMRVHAGSGRLDFSAWNAEADQLAWIVDAAELDRAFDEALRYCPHVQRVDGTPAHQLQALCEGRAGEGRAQLGIEADERRYGHDALATRLVAEQPHRGIAWQWFGDDGEVLALLPLDRPEPGRSFALVWSQPAALAAERAAMPADDFERALQARCAQALRLAGSRQRWPLRWLRSRTVCAPGHVLLGDCAHLVHPLSGQGLNLGFADVLALDRVLARREPWRALGDLKLLRRYERARAADVWLMGELTDGLWRGFAQSPPWLRHAAAEGFSLLDRAAPLKRWMSRQAMGLNESNQGNR